MYAVFLLRLARTLVIIGTTASCTSFTRSGRRTVFITAVSAAFSPDIESCQRSDKLSRDDSIGVLVNQLGEDYNLATGLRQGILQPITTVFFQFGVVFLGFPVEAFAAHAHLNTLYVFGF